MDFGDHPERGPQVSGAITSSNFEYDDACSVDGKDECSLSRGCPRLRTATRSALETEESASMSANAMFHWHAQHHPISHVLLQLPCPTRTTRNVKSGCENPKVYQYFASARPLTDFTRAWDFFLKKNNRRRQRSRGTDYYTAFRQPGIHSPFLKRIVPLALPFVQHRESCLNAHFVFSPAEKHALQPRVKGQA